MKMKMSTFLGFFFFVVIMLAIISHSENDDNNDLPQSQELFHNTPFSSDKLLTKLGKVYDGGGETMKGAIENILEGQVFLKSNFQDNKVSGAQSVLIEKYQVNSVYSIFSESDLEKVFNPKMELLEEKTLPLKPSDDLMSYMKMVSDGVLKSGKVPIELTTEYFWLRDIKIENEGSNSVYVYFSTPMVGEEYDENFCFFISYNRNDESLLSMVFSEWIDLKSKVNVVFHPNGDIDDQNLNGCSVALGGTGFISQ